MLLRDREVKYEYIIRNQNNQTIGSLSNATGSISFDSTREIMRTCSITAKKSELIQISSVDYRVVPYFCILAPNNRWLRYPLGVFIINPSAALNNKSIFVTVEGYDLSQIAYDAKLEDVVSYAEGAVYTSSIANRIGALYTNYEVVTDPDLTNPADIEYEIGASEISVINDMLNAINYYPLYFDENGAGHAEPYIFPEERRVELEYSADNKSVIFDGVTQASNLFSTPNRFVRYTDDPDHGPLRSVFTVTDPSIPSSTVNRGRVITDIEQVDDVATQSTLDNLTRRAAITASQHTETLEFTTVNMPCHSFKTCLQFRCPDIGIDAKYIETAWEMELVPGGHMTHKCEKAVTL
jgi:hypothetical protein